MRSAILPLISPLIQLSLVLLLIHQYQLESRTFFQMTALLVGGFAIHAVLPLAYRLPFFVLLSFGGIGLVFGWRDGGLMIAAGLSLIGICHLPLRFWLRVTLLLCVGAVLAASRGGLVGSPWSAAVWPILASMFMFRLAVYLYAVQHDKAPLNVYRSLAYFFMLPNICFPLFPVVDYGTFGRNYYDRESAEVYQRGIDWIVRGLIHLLLYRLVYLNFAIDPVDVQSLGDVVQFILATYLLYLRVSGQFHIIVGMLHLFGFRLPETHRLYYLASSFTDFWRRINIYWKDFMMKLVYYPSFFRLRRMGDRAALVGATVIVFLATWILHSYQWFWLRGGFPLTAQDGIFWGVLGAFVVVNSLREMKRGRKRTLSQASGWDLELGLRTAAMFWGMTVLWSLWSSESVSGWLGIWAAAGNVDLAGAALICIVTGGLVFAGGRVWDAPVKQPDRRTWFRDPVLQQIAVLAGIILIGYPALREQLPSRLSGYVSSLQSTTLNARDAALQHRGYYEQLDNVSRLSTELWTVQAQRPPDWRGVGDAGYQFRSDFLLREFRPGYSGVVNGSSFTTNSVGMRDQDYAVSRPAGTFRIILLGPSHVAGQGVEDTETLDVYMERILNQTASETGGPTYEVLNFASPAHSLLEQMATLDLKALPYEPNIVILTAPDGITGPTLFHLNQVLSAGVDVPYGFIRAIVDDAGMAHLEREGLALPFQPLRDIATSLGVPTRTPSWEIRRRLEPFTQDLISGTLQHVVDVAEESSASPVLLAYSNVKPNPRPNFPIQEAAERVGMTVLDLFDIYDGLNLAELSVAPWDEHPNATANELIAQRVVQELREKNLLVTP